MKKKLNVKTVLSFVLAGRLRIAWAVKLLPLLLVLVLPVAVQAQYNYTTNNGKITITGYTSGNGVAVIPDTINGLSVTSIGSHAFDGCTYVTSVTIPNSVTNIGGGTFWHCIGLTNLILGNSLVSIGDGQFDGVGYSGAFDSCVGLTSVTIPNSVTYIGNFAFACCTYVTSVTIPNSVTNIGGGAFFDCIGLTNLILGNSLVSIGDEQYDWIEYCGAFASCTNLTSVTIPNSVTYIGNGAFANCTDLTSVYFMGNAPSVAISSYLFSYNTIIYYLPGTTGWGSTFCGLPTAPMPCFLTIQTSSNGTVTGATNGFYAAGTNITLTAHPASHYHLVNWTGTGLTGSDTSSNLTVTLNQDKTITANFAVDQFKLVVNSAYCTGGCVPGIGTNTLNYGLTYCALTNSPKTLSGSSTQYICTGWVGTGDVTSGSGTNTSPFTLDMNSSITWLWQTNYWLSTATNGSGSVDVPSQWCRLGTNVVITATPSDFYWFTGWRGKTNGCSISGNTITAAMNTTRTITAYFSGYQLSDASLGVRSNKFGFTITGSTSMVIVVEACTNLLKGSWSPLGTNKLTNGSSYFSDSKWTNYPCRFYRLNSQ